jgi:hypothetical protein
VCRTPRGGGKSVLRGVAPPHRSRTGQGKRSNWALTILGRKLSKLESEKICSRFSGYCHGARTHWPGRRCFLTKKNSRQWQSRNDQPQAICGTAEGVELVLIDLILIAIQYLGGLVEAFGDEAITGHPLAAPQRPQQWHVTSPPHGCFLFASCMVFFPQVLNVIVAQN